MNKAKPTIMLIAIRQGHFSRELLRGVLDAQLSGQDYNVWVVPPMSDRQHLDACISSQNVIGVIARGLANELVEYLEEHRIPVVSIRGPRDTELLPSSGIHVDDDLVARLAGAEFDRLNLRQWGYVGWKGVTWSEAREQALVGFSQSQAADVKVLSLSEEKRDGWKGVAEIAKWVQGLVKPCGILACNDEAGVAALHACKLAGLSVPEEVAVIGVDNNYLLCESSSPSLSSIDIHAADLGRMAMYQLGERLELDWEGGAKHQEPTVMVIRESSHQVDRYLLFYQIAVNYITSHALRGPSVAEVAESSGLSKRALERVFAKHASVSPGEMIREYRTNGILQLLKNQSLNLSMIAQQSGFADASGLSNFVKRVTGKSPGEWRL